MSEQVEFLKPLKSVALRLVAAIVLMYIGICASLYSLQTALIYSPPSEGTIAHPQQLLLQRPDATLAIATNANQSDKAIVYFGGNAEDVGRDLPSFAANFPDYALYFMNYRGYADSTGEPSEKTLVADGLALFDQVHTQHKQVTIIGRSLGSGIALQIAAQRAAAKLILITPYYSLTELAKRKFPYVPIPWLLRDKYESWRYAPAITTPTLILLAQKDEIIPRTSSIALYKHFKKEVASMKMLAASNHNTIALNPLYFALIKDSLK